MPVDVETGIVIDRPRGRVAAYAADPANAPEWYVNIESVEWKTPPPLAVGSRLAFVARFLGRRLAYTYEIVAVLERG
ncbi:MAG TPA: SRPBCC family protein [Anaeromyxobacter sp.]